MRYEIFIAEDDLINRSILTNFLNSSEFHLTIAKDGAEAEHMLFSKERDFDAIILDNYMPGINGIDLLTKLKQDPDLKTIPVIFQTASKDTEEMRVAVEAGAFYHLVKPLKKPTLLSIVRAAMRDQNNYESLQEEIEVFLHAGKLMQQAQFTFKTLEDARRLSAALSKFAQDPASTHMALVELMINAVEHGNLGITYEEKSAFLANNDLFNEIDRRLQHPDYKDRFATVDYQLTDDDISLTITDMGNGFDFEQYLEFSVERMLDSHGRGIMMANNTGFKFMAYSLGGRRVQCVAQRRTHFG